MEHNSRNGRPEYSDLGCNAAENYPADCADSTILDILPWEDVIHRYVFVCLDLPELFIFRAVSEQARQCVDDYFSCCKLIDMTRISNRITVKAFCQSTHNNFGLRSLILRNSKNWLTDPVLVPVFDVAKNLVKVDMTNCSSLTNATIQKMSVCCVSIQDLSLRECHWLSKEGVLVMAMNLIQLRKLDLTACWDLDDESIMLVANFCKKLTHLYIGKIYSLTDKSITFMAKNSPSLVHLNMQGCWRVTDDAVRFLAEYCKMLKSLQVRECRDITEQSLAKLRVKGIRVDVPAHPWHLQKGTAKFLQSLRLQPT